MAFNTSSQPAQTESGVYKSLGWKIVAGFVIVALLPPAIMFLAAGRTDWWEAWVMVGVLALTTIVSRVILIIKHPDLAVERARWTGKQDFKSWHRKLMPAIAIYGPILVWLVAGLDKRSSGSPPLAATTIICVPVNTATLEPAPHRTRVGRGSCCPGPHQPASSSVSLFRCVITDQTSIACIKSNKLWETAHDCRQVDVMVFGRDDDRVRY